jgi:hypothetical protein
MNTMQIIGHMYVKAKILPVETLPGTRGGRMKKSSGGSQFKYDIFDTI